MKIHFSNIAKISLLALVFGLTAGCATTADLERVEKIAKEAKAAADAANQCCKDTNARIDKMFKGSQKK
ncbi:MAG: hypothetical protein HY942_05365 [Gammaproteobacteria bacterium]|nr:hypothetical protein [Gammaproteobacteria bacterium]